MSLDPQLYDILPLHIYLIERLSVKYHGIFLRVLKYFGEPVGRIRTEKRWLRVSHNTAHYIVQWQIYHSSHLENRRNVSTSLAWQAIFTWLFSEWHWGQFLSVFSYVRCGYLQERKTFHRRLGCRWSLVTCFRQKSQNLASILRFLC